MLRPALARSTVILKEDRSPLEKIMTCGAKDLAFESESESESELESVSESELDCEPVCASILEYGFERDAESDAEGEGRSMLSFNTIGRASTTSLNSRPLGSVRSRRASSSLTVRHTP